MRNINKKQKISLIISCVVVAIYLLGCLIFTFITFPNTYINDENISFVDRNNALESGKKRIDLKITGRNDKKLEIKSEDIDYYEEIPRDTHIDQNVFLWPLAFFKKDDVDIRYNVKYDEAKLNRILEKSQFYNNVKEPEDAQLVIDGDHCVILDEVYGDKLDDEKFKKSILDAIHKKESVLELKDEYVKPKITKDDKNLKEGLKKSKEIDKLDIKYDLGTFEYELKGNDLLKLFVYDDNWFHLSRDKAYEYFKKMAEDTDTYGTYREFNATGLGTITVNPGLYGYLMDVDQTVSDFFDILDARKSGTFEPAYIYKGVGRFENGDIGNTYVEIDLSRQTMWVYLEGNLVLETPIVSGDISHKVPTNVGVGKILSKETDKVLKGDDYDGGEYNYPVKYWMPIGWDGEGIHDTSTRGSYGGGIYFNNGSHGCINTPPSNAAYIYNNVPVGTPVIVYESSTGYSPNMTY